MTRVDRHYVRVYHDDLQRDYPAIYADDAALAAWLRLLVVADKMWPSIPELPRSIRPRALYTLVESGLVEQLPGHCFRIRGHDAERAKRQQSAKDAAASRWQSKGNAAGTAERMPSRAETETETEYPSPAERGRRMDGTNPRALGTNPRANGTSPRQVREEQKRGGLTSIHDILQAAAKGGKG